MPRPRNLFVPNSPKPFKISRNGLELFHNCPRCFYFDKRLGLKRPSSYPLTLNSAVDKLLKREFDGYREQRRPHPLMTEAGIDAVPFAHPELEKWRTNFTGVQFVHGPSNFLVHGAVDDLWETTGGKLIVVDYKATARRDEVVQLNEDWQRSYKRQIEIYQWLLRQNGFKVSERAYWVYANGDVSRPAFGKSLNFRMTVIPYDGKDDWVEGHIMAAKECLMRDTAPDAAEDCEWCEFAAARNRAHTTGHDTQ